MQAAIKRFPWLALTAWLWLWITAGIAPLSIVAAEQAAGAGPVGWWKFDEGAGTIVKDGSGHGLHGTIRGAAKWIPGVAGSALSLDGNSLVEIPFDRRLALGEGLTIQVFMRPAEAATNSYKHLVDLWESYLLRLDNPPEGGQLSFFTFLKGDPEPRVQAGVPALGKWHQVVAVWDGTKLQLWLDGVKRERARAGQITPKEASLRLGANFVGDIDEVRIYNRALTENEILDQVPPKLEVALQAPRPLFEIGQPFSISCLVSNVGGQPLADGVVELVLPEGLALVEGEPLVSLPVVTRTTPKSVRWRLQAKTALATTVQVTTTFKGLEPVHKTAKCVVARPIPNGEGTFQEPTLTTADGDVVLGNARLRLVFPRNSFGYGVFAVDGNQGGRWTRMAVASGFSCLAVKYGTKTTRGFIMADEFVPLASEPGQAGVVFRASATDSAGTGWTCRFTFRLAADDRAKIQYEAVPDQDGALVLLEGPMLHVGEGSFGARKDDGLFCGLEWLVGEEASSSNLDMHDPDYYRRFVPHPNKITIPLMAFSRAGAAIALYWDCLQKWNGTNDRPAAVFAAPNFVEAQDNNLMGLFLPAAPEWVGVNQLEAAERPYPFRRLEPLRLEAWIACASPARQSVACVSRWFKTFGVPEPASLPRGDYVKEIEFSMRAFLESLWVVSEQKWWTSKGAGELLSQKSLPPHYAAQLRLAAIVTKDATLKTTYAERAALAERLGGFSPQWDDLGFTWGYPPASLAALGNAATAQLDSMGDDGAWRFRTRLETNGVFKGMDYALLGPDKAAELGTCAQNAFQVLRFCRLTGDAEVFGAAQKALSFMEQFTVPRAAQVWECPVHSPDILAAADAMDAYLEAYRFSGERHYLEEAVRWAGTGLPFVYVWNPPGKPMLRYASIAIFGGSWYGGSWIGQPVQWNGLRYAYALLKLAEYDQSLPWRRIAEGITVSALYQQDADGPNVALWPDNFSATDWSKCPWVFEPSLILKNVFKLLERDIEPATTILGTGAARLFLSSRARITDASWLDNRLRFTARFPDGESGAVLVAGVAKPAHVRANGAELTEAPGGLDQPGLAGWKHEFAPGFLSLRLPAAGPFAMEIEGAKHHATSLIPKLVDAIAFEFEPGLEGWMPASQIENLRVEGGILKGRASGGDPFMHRQRLRVHGNLCPEIRVKAKAGTGEGIALFWVTAESPAWGEDKGIHLSATPDGTFHEYRFAVGQQPLWAGQTITGIRLDPIEGGGGGDFEVDYVKAGAR